MAIRTGAKQFKALEDMALVLHRASNAARELSRNDPDRRSTAPLDASTRLRLRTASNAYIKNTARLRQLFEGKFAKYDKALLGRITEIRRPIGKRGRPAGSGRKRGRGRPRTKR